MSRLKSWLSGGVIALSIAITGTVGAQQPLKIGFGMSLTGPLAGNGKAALISMEIWKDDVNAKGGILGRKVEYDKSYRPNPVDFSPIVGAIQAPNPDLVFLASYPPDSAGMVRAVNEVGLKARMFGGGLVGPQFAALRTQLGPLLNGIVNYESYTPEVAQQFPFLEQFLAKYQTRAVKEGVDPLGYYLPPYAYAMMQVLEQAIKATGGLDQAKLADYMHKNEFDTFVGKVRFAKNGEWSVPRMLTVQYHGISGNDLEQWKKPGHVTVLYPANYKTGDVKSPYQDNKK